MLLVAVLPSACAAALAAVSPVLQQLLRNRGRRFVKIKIGETETSFRGVCDPDEAFDKFKAIYRIRSSKHKRRKKSIACHPR
jgi:hypothetical protein